MIPFEEVSPSLAARLQILVAAMLFSTGGTVIKAASFSSLQVAGLRAGIAAAAILTCIPQARSSWSPRVILLGMVYGLMTTSFVTANKLTTAASAIFLQDTAPVYLVIAGPLLLREPVRRDDFVFLALSLAGMSLFFFGSQTASATAPNPALGNLAAIVASVTWAMVIGGMRWLERSGGGREPGLATVVTGCGVAFLVGLPSILTIESAAWKDWLAVAYLGLFQIGLAYVFLTRGMRGVPAFEASLILLVEPVLSPIWAWLVHGEQPGIHAMAGGGLILAAMLWQMQRRARSA